MALIAISSKKKPHSEVGLPADLPTVKADEFALTERAARRIAYLTANDPEAGEVLKVSVRGGGCSGFSYIYQLVKKAEESDFLVSLNGVTACVDKKSMRLLGGSVLDWHDYMKKSGFRIINPHAKTSCSCGESFSI